MTALRRGNVSVSEHALLRFLERVDGVDIGAAVQRMVPDDLEYQMAVVGGTGKFPGPSGFTLVVRNGRVITIVSS